MGSATNGTDSTDYVQSNLGAIALGLSWLIVGLGLLATILTNSVDLFVGVAAVFMALLAISLSLVFRTEGVLTMENLVIAAFVVVSLGFLFGLSQFTDLPSVVVFGVVLVVGVLAPSALLGRTSLGGS